MARVKQQVRQCLKEVISDLIIDQPPANKRIGANTIPDVMLIWR